MPPHATLAAAWAEARITARLSEAEAAFRREPAEPMPANITFALQTILASDPTLSWAAMAQVASWRRA